MTHVCRYVYNKATRTPTCDCGALKPLPAGDEPRGHDGLTSAERVAQAARMLATPTDARWLSLARAYETEVAEGERLRTKIADYARFERDSIANETALLDQIVWLTRERDDARKEAGQLRAWQAAARADLSKALAQRDAALAGVRACWDEAAECHAESWGERERTISECYWNISNAKAASEVGK